MIETISFQVKNYLLVCNTKSCKHILTLEWIFNIGDPKGVEAFPEAEAGQ
jgi:hypothetical protein